MRRFSSSVLLIVASAAFVVVLGGEAAWWRHEKQAAVRARTTLRQEMRERSRLLAQAPALNAANEQAIADDWARTRRELAGARAELEPGETNSFPAAAPTRTLEAFFDLARFVERNRAAAAAAKVALRPDERFGFAMYTNEGPQADVLRQVYRQRVVSESLLEHLIAAHPRALLALRREDVAPAQPPAKNQNEDYFVMDRALSVRRPGDIDTLAFRVEFSGHTATLRSFLTGIAGTAQALLVRSVDVEPLAALDPAAATGAPLVRQNLSKFSVVVESARPAFPPSQVVP